MLLSTLRIHPVFCFTSWLQRLLLMLTMGIGMFGCLQFVQANQHPYFSKHPQAQQKLEQLLQAAQMQALEMQPADLSITLKDLEGQEHSLERYRGQLLMLTRWATWCGACKSELPFKAQLHQQIQDKRFQLIGISDETQDTVNDYQKSASTVYPVSLLDPQGVMTKFFPGGAIPVTLVVDGWGWLVAMKRGGAPWNQPAYEQLVRYLLSIAPTPEQLKEKAPAPEVRFPPQVQVHHGQIFSLVFSLRWIGESDKYTRIAFRLPEEKGLQQLGIKATGMQESGGQNQRNYILRIKAAKPGTYQLNPILMNYWIKDYDQHFQIKAGTMTVRVLSASHVSRTQYRWPFMVLGVAVFLLVLMVFLVRAQKRALQPPSEQEVARQQRETWLLSLLEELHTAHHSGDPKAQIDAIYQIYRKILEDVPDAVVIWRDDIRYGNKDFPTDERRQLLSQLATDLKTDHPEAAKRIQAM